MDWNDWLSILRWRALEEADADGALLSEERRREATAHSRGALSTEGLKAEPLGGRELAFLRRRAGWLEHEVIGWSGSLVRLMERLTVARGRWSWALLGWLGAVVIGYSISGLGQEAEFNLLALPLVGVLVWNAVVMLLALVWEFLPQKKMRSGKHGKGLLEWLERRLTPSPGKDEVVDGDTVTGITVDQRFSTLVGPIAMERLHRRLRAWFHIAAALLALGSAIGLYARGWSKEYRAVWESTLLNEKRAEKFFDGLFGPASRVFNLEIPLENVREMHRTGGVTKSSAPALPWIHLYAATLGLMVLVPRFGLAGLTLLRGRVITEGRLRNLPWQNYLVRMLRGVEGGQEKITVLVHGTTPTPQQRELWARGVRERFGGLVTPEMVHVALGDEDEFVTDWRPATSQVMVVFNLATTPEAEVQRRFVADVRQSLLARQRDAELMVLLDATSIGNRWSPDKVAGRERLWTDMMQGVADEVIIAARRASMS